MGVAWRFILLHSLLYSNVLFHTLKWCSHELRRSNPALALSRCLTFSYLFSVTLLSWCVKSIQHLSKLVRRKLLKHVLLLLHKLFVLLQSQLRRTTLHLTLRISGTTRNFANLVLRMNVVGLLRVSSAIANYLSFIQILRTRIPSWRIVMVLVHSCVAVVLVS